MLYCKSEKVVFINVICLKWFLALMYTCSCKLKHYILKIRNNFRYSSYACYIFDIYAHRDSNKIFLI